MAAIVQPHRHLAPLHGPVGRPSRPVRPALRLVPPPSSSRPSLRPVAGLIGALLLVVMVGLGAVAVGRGALASLAPAPAGTPGASVTPGTGPQVSVVVQPGDSLWTIARRIQPTGDVRALVDRLAAANGSVVVHVGDHLSVRR